MAATTRTSPLYQAYSPLIGLAESTFWEEANFFRGAVQVTESGSTCSGYVSNSAIVLNGKNSIA